MKHYDTKHVELMATLLELQNNTAPIELSIGYARDGIVRHGVMLQTAPPLVIEALRKAGYTLDLTREGLMVLLPE